MRLKLDLSLTTLTALFQPDDGGGYFPGPVIAVSSSSGREGSWLVTGFNWRRGDTREGPVVYDFTEPVLFCAASVPFCGVYQEVDVRTCLLDLSIPWVHERVAATCLRLLGVQDVRAACMTVSSFGTVYTLRWVGERDGWPWPHTATAEDRKRDAWPLPYTASWDKLGGAPVVGAYQNDLVSAYRLKLSSIPRLELQPGATGDEALGALLLALDGREAGKAKGDR